jgi:DNA-binding protein H-NS
MNIESMTLEELETLAADVRARIEELRRERVAELRRSLEQQAKEAGVDIRVLLGKRRQARAQTSLAPRYRDPEDPTRTWCGVGKRPAWYREAIAAGITPEQMAV